MTDIDSKSEMELLASDKDLVARIPLSGHVTDSWLKAYQRLASANRVPARAEGGPDRAWLVVNVPANGSKRDVTDTMDSARSLLADADEAARTAEARADTADTVRSWWADRRLQASRRPVSKIEAVRTGTGAEKRWILALALATAIAVLFVLPPRFSVGPDWLVPSVEGLLLIAVLIADGIHTRYRSATVRALSSVLIVVLVSNGAFITIRLVIDLLQGGPETSSATELIKVGFAVWIYTIIAFAFLYWLLADGGPEARIWSPPKFPDLAFPEQLNPGVGPPGWRAQFLDYLYLSFTDSTAFSPTDVMPLARWGKVVMTIQAVVSLGIGGLVIARAVNIFK